MSTGNNSRVWPSPADFCRNGTSTVSRSLADMKVNRVVRGVTWRSNRRPA
jgi:hypothetical protein